MKNRLFTAVATALCVSMSATADLAAYSQDFEGLDQASGSALGDDGWLVGANVFDPTGNNFLYNYFAFPAPNGGPSFSAVTTGQGGPDQGAQGLVVYNDYNNGDHAVSNQIEAIVFREWVIGTADVGNTVTFSFDAKKGDLAAPTTANAFIKTFGGSGESNFLTVDTTALPETWDTYSIDLLIDEAWVGDTFQIGFSSTTSNYTPSGVNYDNVNVAIPEPTTIAFMGIFGGAMLFLRRFKLY